MEPTYTTEQMYNAAEHLYRFSLKDDPRANRWLEIMSFFWYLGKFRWNVKRGPVTINEASSPTPEEARQLVREIEASKQRKPLEWLSPMAGRKLKILGPLRPPKVKLMIFNTPHAAGLYPTDRYPN